MTKLNVTQIVDGVVRGSGGGDVTGPATTTDNAIARWDGTTGNKIQDSSVLIDDSDNVSGIGTLSAGSTTVTALSVSDGNITNVGDIALDTISSDAGSTVSVTLGTDAGDNFTVGNNNALVVEGDTDSLGIVTGKL